MREQLRLLRHQVKQRLNNGHWQFRERALLDLSIERLEEVTVYLDALEEGRCEVVPDGLGAILQWPWTRFGWMRLFHTRASFAEMMKDTYLPLWDEIVNAPVMNTVVFEDLEYSVISLV